MLNLVTFRAIGEALKPVEDPEIRMSIAELGLVYGAKIEPAQDGQGQTVKVSMSLTSPACPYGPMLLESVRQAVSMVPGVKEVGVDITFEPSWDPCIMASDEAKEMLGIF